MSKYTRFFIVCFLLFIFAFSVQADELNDKVIFNVDPKYEYLSRDQIPATLRKISTHAYWYISDEYWDNLSVSSRASFLTKLNELAFEFDNRIYPTETNFWGSEYNPGIDNDSRITIFLTELISEAGGFVDTGHEYKKERVPESNEREMIFLNTLSFENNRAKIFLAHEFQHLISFYQKVILNNVSEDVWLNEARSEYTSRLLGYDNVFESSNLKRRLRAFVQSPSDPLAEWKNQSPDYGAITLFINYLADQYGDKVLVDSLKSKKTGMASIDEALRLNGFSENFSDVFSNWTIANFLNDDSVDPRFSYKFSKLKELKVQPTQSYMIYNQNDVISISNFMKDWQPFWYEITTPVGINRNLKIVFSGAPGSNFKVPYIIYNTNGERMIGVLSVGSTTTVGFVKDFGSKSYKIILIPSNQSKFSDFTENDPSASLNIKIQLVREIPENLASSPESESSPLVKTEVSSDPQQRIQEILEKLKELKERLSLLKQQQGQLVEPVEKKPFVLTRDLFLGKRGDDVKWLQEFLINQGVYPEALVTGYFGNLTRKAVIVFQRKFGISPAMGYVGSITRNKIKELLD